MQYVCIQRLMSSTVSLWRSVTRLLIYVLIIVTLTIYGFLFSCFYSTVAMPSKGGSRPAASEAGVEVLSYFEHNDIYESLSWLTCPCLAKAR